MMDITLKGKYQYPLNDLLSENEVFFLLDLIQKNIFCKVEDELRGLLFSLRYLIPYDHAICLACDGINTKLNTYDLINISYPSEWIELYISKKYYQVDPIIRDNFTYYQLQYWSDTYKKYSAPKEFFSCARDFGLVNGYSYGLRNRNGKGGSLFSFAGDNVEYHPRNATILLHIIPHLHEALISIAGFDRDYPCEK